MYEYYDLSPTLSPESPAWPTDPPVVFEPFKSIDEGGSSNVTKLTIGTHAGSHVDAPRHFLTKGTPVDELPLDLLIGEALIVHIDADVIDAHSLGRALGGRDTERLLIKTRNSALWSEPGFNPDFLGLEPSAGELIVERGIKMVGVDYLSIESTHGTGAPVHTILLTNDVVIIESLNLSALPPGDCELFCLPLNLAGLDGAPARVVARVPK